MNIELSINSMRLEMDPVRGRRTFYLRLRIGRRAWWVMRWDTERVRQHKKFAFSCDGLMCWSAGIHRA